MPNNGYNSLWYCVTPKFSIFNTADFYSEKSYRICSQRNDSLTVTGKRKKTTTTMELKKYVSIL